MLSGPPDHTPNWVRPCLAWKNRSGEFLHWYHPLNSSSSGSFKKPERHLTGSQTCMELKLDYMKYISNLSYTILLYERINSLNSWHYGIGTCIFSNEGVTPNTSWSDLSCDLNSGDLETRKRLEASAAGLLTDKTRSWTTYTHSYGLVGLLPGAAGRPQRSRRRPRCCHCGRSLRRTQNCFYCSSWTLRRKWQQRRCDICTFVDVMKGFSSRAATLLFFLISLLL